MRKPGKLGVVGVVLVAVGCVGGSQSKTKATGAAPTASATSLPLALASDTRQEPPSPVNTQRRQNTELAQGSPLVLTALDAYRASVAEHPDLTHEQLRSALGVHSEPATPLGFDPRKASFYRLVSNKLSLSKAEREMLDRQGVLQLQSRDGLSMAQQYLAIYVNDLPVLITSDSILDALHRSYDKLLATLEQAVFLPLLTDVLYRAHDAAPSLPATTDDELRTAKCDASLYIEVALDLLSGKGSDAPNDSQVESAQRPRAKSLCAADSDRKRILNLVAGLQMQLPGGLCTPIYGTKRCIDFSQFRPRGHYAGKRALEAYFRSMMWLGREDTGLRLSRSGQGAEFPANAAREARAAIMLSHWLASTGGIERLSSMDRALSVLVGQGEFLGPRQVQQVLAQQNITEPAQAVALGNALPGLLAKASPTRGVRSQMTTPANAATESAPFGATFQLFGQRFLIDSLVLSKVVYDSTRNPRLLPSGLDVMAALGNDEAVTLLSNELDTWKYAPQLLGARQAVRAYFSQPPSSFHHRWLAALQTLHAAPEGVAFPQVMRTEVWRRKSLQTQLAAWSQIRRDNVLYAAQSYSAYAVCDYPKGYVEPYPALYHQLANTLETMENAVKELLPAISGDNKLANIGQQLVRTARDVQSYTSHARDLLLKLEAMARKELDGKPFTRAEEAFLKTTIQEKTESMGCTSRTIYTGWYPELVYGTKPLKFEPVVADVHSSQSGFLENAVGHNELLVAAIDNGKDLAVYVGPTYTHYEFVSSERLTDAEWTKQLENNKTPSRPAWTAPLVAPPSTGNARRPRLSLPEWTNDE